MIDSRNFCNICGREMPLHKYWTIQLGPPYGVIGRPKSRDKNDFGVSHVCRKCTLYIYKFIRSMVKSNQVLYTQFLDEEEIRELENQEKEGRYNDS